MSGERRAEIAGLPADVTDLVFLSDSAALVCGVRGGQVVVLGMPAKLRGEARMLINGRSEGMQGLTLQVVSRHCRRFG